MATISSLGSSGLPLQETLDKLEKAENRRLQLIANQQASQETRISAFGKVQGAVEAVQKAAADLGKMGSASTLSTTVTGDGLTASTDNKASAGNYTVKVTQLAMAQSLRSGAFSSRTADNGTGGTLNVTIDGKVKTLELGSDTSLNGIAKTINGDSSLGLSATVINDGQANFYLMLTAKSEGEKAAVTKLEISGNSELADKLNFTAGASGTGMQEQVKARNAELTINGVAVISQSNTVTQAIDGVTLNLSAVTAEDSPGATVKIAMDVTKVHTLTQAFVNAYNALQVTISGLTAFDVQKESQSPLTGDGTVRGIQASVAAALRVATPEGDIRTLTGLGISIDPNNGQLKFDSEKFNKVAAENITDVTRVFAGPDGLSAKMNEATSKILGAEGSIKSRTTGLEKQLASLEKQYKSTEQQIAGTMSLYRTQFAKLDALVVQMKGTSEYLNQQFAALNNTKK